MERYIHNLEINDFLIDDNLSVIRVMERLDKVSKKVLFIVKKNQLVASITDGDIRRWILKRGSLDSQVKEIANYAPKYLKESEKDTAKEYMKEHFIQGLPIVNEKMKIVSIILLNDEEYHSKFDSEIAVVIMAGGKGSRLYPYTKILPKPLIPIGEVPIVELIIDRFQNFGVSLFYLVVNYKKNMIKAYFNEISKDYEMNYIEEEKPLGTAGGLAYLKNTIKSTFILTNCDILIEADYKSILEHHKKERNLITMVCSVKNFRIPYGVIDLSETGEIESMREKPEFSFLINAGMYFVESKVIDEINENEMVDFPDLINKYKDNGFKIGIYPISENSWMDMGEFNEMERMRKGLGYEE